MADNNTLRKDLGPVTAYAIAVQAGFEGTQEEWVRRISTSVDQQSFDTLAASVESGDTALSDKIDTEVEALSDGIDTEAETRAAADTNLSGQIDTLSETVTGKDTTLRNILVHKPVDPLSQDGTAGQVLTTHGDGTTEWTNAGQPTDAQATTAVEAWLTAHPEATTTVQDGAVSRAKLDAELQSRSDLVTNSLAPFFSQSVANGAGSYVIYGNKLYLLPNGHEVDVTWENTTKAEAKTTGEIKNLSDDVSGLKSALDGYSEYNAHNVVLPVTNHTSEYNTVFTKTGVNTVYVDTSNLNPNNRNPDYYYVYLDSTDMPVEPGKSYSLTVNTTDNSNLTLQIWVKDSSDNRTILYSGGSTSNYKITIPSNAYSFTLRYLAHKAVGTGTIGFTLFDEAELSPKRAETQKLIFDGLGIIDADFVVGVATNTGTINTSPKYANTTKQIVSIPFDVNLRPENGYQFFLQLFNDDGTFNKTTSWVLNELYHIEANQKFMLTIVLSPLNTSYVSSENEFKTCVRFERTNRQWIGKNWYAFGTSISDTTFPMPYDLPGYTGKYPPYLAQLSGLIHSNYALGGSRITNSATADRDTILEKILATDLTDADLITIDGFVNDFGACEIGDLESLTPETADDTTLYGAMFLAITHCLENSNAVVCLLTDNTGKLWTTPGGTVHPVDLRPWKKDGHGKTQDDYCDAMRKIATYLGCYCIDAGSMSSINYCHPEYIQDTIHQSIAGGKQYANAIWSVLKNIQPNVPRT